MVSREQILEALTPLVDRQFGKSIVELNLVRDMIIKPERVSMTLLLTSGDETWKAELRKQIEEKLKPLQLPDLHLRFRELTDTERSELRKKAGGAEGNGQAKGAENNPPLHERTGIKYIAIASGKGGVGKSTVTVNLAAALARLGKKVGLIDADIYGFSVPDMMGIEEAPKLVDGLIEPVRRFGVQVISMGFFVQDNAPVIWRGPMLGKMLRNFFNEVRWDGDLEYLLLDLPPGTGDVALDVHQMLPQSREILVTTPHATAAYVAARAGAMATRTNHQILGVVENMAYYECSRCGEKEYIFGRGGGAKLAETLHTELLAQIPLGAPDNHPSEPEFSPSIYKPDTPTGRLFIELAERIVAKWNG
jgi:ATP-binding protein involved in chromosome partitioning